MRISYSEDEDFPGQFELWQANCVRSLHGKKGQVALRELEAALLALPDKRLIADHLIDADGEVCALGALAKYKGHELVAKKSGDGDEDEWDEFDLDGEMEEFGVELGMPRLVAWKVVCRNDEEIYAKTPEERYDKMLAWVQNQIQPTGPQVSA